MAPGSLRGPSGRLLNNHPVCGRKHCKTCSRWRLLLDFSIDHRTNTGRTLRWSSECKTCKNRRQARNMARHEAREAKRERDRLYEAMKRDQRGTLGTNPQPSYRRPTAPRRERVPVAPLREAFLDSEWATHQSAFCRRIGWVDKDGNPETSRLQRRLGIREERGVVNQSVDYDTAVTIVKGMEITPALVGV